MTAGGPYSHPPENGRDGVRLLDHLQDVRDRVGMVLSADATTSAGESLVDIVERLALIHDIGKATTFFQRYVLEGVDPSPPAKRHHSPLGAFAAYFVLDDAGYAAETCVAGFVAVAKHHGRLPAVADYVRSRTTDDGGTERRSLLRLQVEDIRENAPVTASTVFADATGSTDGWEAFVEAISDGLFDDIASHVVRETPVTTTPKQDPFSEDFYGLLLSCWGTLVLADKTSAASAPGTESPQAIYQPVQPTVDALDAHVTGLEAEVDADPEGDRTERLNYHRSQARTEVLDAVPGFVGSDASVATITLPTGLGKTLTGLSAALSIRDEIDAERVVYALPFTSIIDQVADVAGTVFDTDGTDRLLTVHHHLSDTRVGLEDETDFDAADLNDDVAGMLGESWRAGLTITTFVQLFESLAGPRNSQSMKLPALRDAVVVLDEPQSLPLEWWSLVRRLAELLTEQYDATVVSMTATRPQLFEERVELVDDPGAYFDLAERIRYRLHDSVERFLDDGTEAEPLGYARAADEFVETVAAGEATLGICNTIDSARRLTDAVTDQLSTVDVAERYLEASRTGDENVTERTTRAVLEADGVPFVHLSSRMRPTDRLALVNVIQELRDRGARVAAVTTQLVEAGVDVSFEAIYRDLAPIDSVVQAAGRCNRSFEREHGDATVWWLDAPGDQSKTPAVAVYDRGTALTPVTAQALDHVRDEASTLSGSVVARDAVKEYYRRLHEEKDVGREAYADLVDDADGDGLAELSLIDTPRTVDIVVCLTEADEQLVDEIEAAHERYEFEQLDELLDETKPLRVSIPIYDTDSEEADVVLDLPPLTGDDAYADLRVLRANSHQHAQYFDETTGFVVPDDTVENRFL